MIKAEITSPLEPSKILRSANDIVPSLNVVSIVDSSVSIETQAAASPTAFDAEYTGLLYLRYLTTFIIAIVIVPNVYNRLKISYPDFCVIPTFQKSPTVPAVLERKVGITFCPLMGKKPVFLQKSVYP